MVSTKKWGPFLLLAAIGTVNYPGFYSFPFAATPFFLAAQLALLTSIYLVSKKDRKTALFLFAFNLYALFLSSRAIYFSRPFMLESELLLRGKPTFYFYWYFLLSALVLATTLRLALRLRKNLRYAALVAMALLVGIYALNFYRGSIRFSVGRGKIFVDGHPVMGLRGKGHRVITFVGRARKTPRGVHMWVPKGILFSLKNFKIVRVDTLLIKKEGTLIRVGDRTFPVFFPWHLLEIFLLPFSLLFLFMWKRVRGLRFSLVLLLVILGFLFLLQGLYFYRVSPGGFLYFDTWEYLIRAESLLRGFSFGEEILVGGNGPCHWPPGTIYYNALFVWLFSRNWTAYIFFKTLLFLMALLVLKKIGEEYRLPPAALVVLTGLSGYTIYFASVESEGLFLPFFLLGFYLLGRTEGRAAFWTGGLLGLSSLIRPIALVFAPLWPAVKKRREGLALLFALLLVVGPWSIRCSLKEKRLVPVSRAGPYTFLEGNSPFSNGGWLVPASVIRKWERMGHDPTSVREIIAYNLRHPGNILRLIPLKLYWAFWKEPKNRQWHPPGVPGEKHYGISLLRFKFYTPFSEGVKLVLYLLALVGVLTSLKNPGKFRFPLVTLGGFILMVLLFFGLPRYTSPFSPFVYLFSLKGWKDVS